MLASCSRGVVLACIAGILIGVLPAHADPPASVTYTYDDAGRLRNATYSDGKVADYQYDPAGNRTVVTHTPTATLSIASPLANVTEGGTLLFRVTRTGTNTQNITVDCKPVDGTADSGGPIAPWLDYSVTPSVITFLPSDPNPTTKNCSVLTTGDSYYEGPETVWATLSTARGGAVITTVSAVGTINDDDAAPSLSVAGEAKTEGSALTFTITKTGLSEYAHDVSFATSDGTALTSDSDYAAANGVAGLSVGATSTTISVQTTVDAKYEANETLTLTLSAPTAGAVLGTSSAAGTINNDDTAPSVAINDASAFEGSAVTFTVTKTGSTGLSHSFNWASANGTAVAPGDYTAGSGTVVFAPSDTTKTLQVQTATDAVVDLNETFAVSLTTNASTNGATISDAQGTGTIIDTNLPTVPGNCRTNPTPISSGSYTVLWDASGGASTYVLEEDSSGSDFSPPTATFTINAPTTQRAFTKNGNPLEFSYRVKACNASNQCSAYSNIAFITVCSPNGVCN